MDEQDKIEIALRAIRNGWDYEGLKYSNDMYGNELYTDDVWEYITECELIGLTSFCSKYKV